MGGEETVNASSKRIVSCAPSVDLTGWECKPQVTGQKNRERERWVELERYSLLLLLLLLLLY
jgi:hypothetical protein